jgi:hypothetical protein
MHPTLLVGCPARRRDWIIDRWLCHVAVAAAKVDVDLAVVVLGPSDDKTLVRAEAIAHAQGIALRTIDSGERADEIVTDPAHAIRGEHYWDSHRLEHIVTIRNMLLTHVRTIRPEWFLSLDSDVLLHEDALSAMFETLRGSAYSAVGGKTYMCPMGTNAPSYAQVDEDERLVRPDSALVAEVDVIMAIKLMLPAAYSVDYQYDARGEDIGWSLACQRRGLTLGWDGRVISTHVMRRGRFQAGAPARPP